MISIVMLTKDNEKYIEDTLSSIQDFPEVILLDTGSKDNTLSIAQKFSNVRIYQKPFTGFGALRNYGATLASHDWIFALDSDEIVSKELSKEICSYNLQRKVVYSLRFHNYFQDKWIKGCGWHPEKHIRIYHRKDTSFSQSMVHESVKDIDCTTIIFKSPIIHTPYRDMDDFLHKMQKYTTLFAEQNRNKKKSSFSKAILHGYYAFIKSYFLQKGFLQGKGGFIISYYNANTAFYKYLKLSEVNKSGTCL